MCMRRRRKRRPRRGVWAALSHRLHNFGLDCESLVDVATDGAPAVQGRKNGMMQIMKSELTESGFNVSEWTTQLPLHHTPTAANRQSAGITRCYERRDKNRQPHTASLRNSCVRLTRHTTTSATIQRKIRWVSRSRLLKQFISISRETQFYWGQQGYSMMLLILKMRCG